MNGPIDSARGALPKALLLLAFAVAMFLAGRLWSLRAVREAQRAAGLAERERLALQAELAECRNALLLQRERETVPAGDRPEEDGAHASRIRARGHAPDTPSEGPAVPAEVTHGLRESEAHWRWAGRATPSR